MALTANPYLVENDGSKLAIGGQLRLNVAAGAASGVLIVVTDMARGDQIHSVVDYAAGVPTDRTAGVESVEAGGFKLGTGSASGNKVVVTWLDRKQS